MGSPFDNTPAVKSPSRYAALNMHGEQFTGLWTQANPYRDAAVAYLVSKFYGGSRIDRIIDGLNREITQDLTDKRRPGNPAYSSFHFPPLQSFYSWKYIQDGVEIVRVLADEDGTGFGDRNIWDTTPGDEDVLFAKTDGAGPARFLGVNTELFFGDGVEQKKIIGAAKTWQANTTYNTGDLIVNASGNVQQAFSVALVLNIDSVQQFSATSPGGTVTQYVVLILDDEMGFPANWGTVALAGLTGATWLNGTTLTDVVPIGPYGNALQGVTTVTHAAYPPTADTGTATGVTLDGSGESGATQPIWSATQLGFVTDNEIRWRNFGDAVKDWGIPAPPKKPSVAPAYNTELYWEPNTSYTTFNAIFDVNENVEIAIAASAPTGFNQPVWGAGLGAQAIDGGLIWQNCGQATTWQASTNFLYSSCILDPNGNLQVALDVINPGTSGASPPTWLTALGAMTADNDLTWFNCGPGTVLVSADLQYSYSWHSIDGTVSTAAPLNVSVVNGVLGAANPGFGLAVTGAYPAGISGMPFGTSSQIDEVWIWRTPQGEPTLILLNTIPVLDLTTASWTYLDLLPDTALNAQIAAPVAESADPPPVGMTAPAYHLQRVWGIVDNMVQYSAGPDAVTGNGNTQFPPLNFIPYPAQPVYLLPVTVQGGGIIVFTTSGAYIILGTGTATDPFYTTIYYASVNLAGYNAIDVYNTAAFLMESNGKVSTLAIEYPFNPQSGYTEIGFPIGDQFKKVTTGGISTALYNPATAYVSWNIQSSAETGMFVSDGAIGWFSMQMINAPETGILWNPRAAIVGGTSAVQSIETAPGLHQLLIGPPAGGGRILVRDSTEAVFTDNGTPYPGWDIKGVMTLCATGQWCEVAHVSAKSVAVGARPVVSTLMGEIRPTANHPWNVLKLNNKSNDPAETPKSESVYSDRYLLAENGVPYTGDCISIRFDYGSQDEPDELLDFGIFAALMNEREEQVPGQQ